MVEPVPVFSVVIPTYARPQQIRNCLEALRQVDYPRERFEVIVVDDGSDRPVQSGVKDYHQRLDLQVVRQENRGPATARNVGAAHARGEYLIFTDDDCCLAADYLAQLALRVRKQPESMIGGRTVNALTGNIYASASQLLIDFLFAWFNTDSARTVLFTSNNLVVPADHFARIGGFDTSFPLAAGEDRELCERWQHSGRSMAYAPELIVYHAHALTLGSFWRQHLNYGRGAHHYRQTAGRRSAARQRVEPFAFYLKLLLYPLTQRHGLLGGVYLLLLCLSQVANVVGFLSARRSHRAQAKHAQADA